MTSSRGGKHVAAVRDYLESRTGAVAAARDGRAADSIARSGDRRRVTKTSNSQTFPYCSNRCTRARSVSGKT